MRKLIITQNISLDGVIDLSTGWFQPAGGEADDSDLVAELRAQDADADGLLLGRQTFEDFRRYWPLQTDDKTGITDYLNTVQKYVLSSTLSDPGWQNSTVLRGPLEEDVRTLKDRGGLDIVATGSITVTRALIAAGLVDEYRLFVYPVVVGSGRQLFADAANVGKLQLLKTKPFRSGVVLVTYRPQQA